MLLAVTCIILSASSRVMGEQSSFVIEWQAHRLPNAKLIINTPSCLIYSIRLKTGDKRHTAISAKHKSFCHRWQDSRGQSGSVKSNQIKSNHFYCHITTAQVPWWVKFLWACSRQCRKTRQFTYGQTVQKNHKQFTYGQTVQKKLHWSIYSAPDSAKKKQKTQQQQFTYGQTVQKNNINLHMDSTYLQTVQKTMCKIHIHILSTHSVL